MFLGWRRDRIPLGLIRLVSFKLSLYTPSIIFVWVERLVWVIFLAIYRTLWLSIYIMPFMSLNTVRRAT